MYTHKEPYQIRLKAYIDSILLTLVANLQYRKQNMNTTESPLTLYLAINRLNIAPDIVDDI